MLVSLGHASCDGIGLSHFESAEKDPCEPTLGPRKCLNVCFKIIMPAWPNSGSHVAYLVLWGSNQYLDASGPSVGCGLMALSGEGVPILLKEAFEYPGFPYTNGLMCRKGVPMHFS